MKERKAFHMFNEIYEYPSACVKTFESISQKINSVTLNNCEKIIFTGCGTSLFAAHTARPFFELITKKICMVENATELFNRCHLLDSKTCVIALSQSGTSTDTILTLERAKKSGSTIISLVNTPNSPMEKISHHTFLTMAGKESAIPSTKAFAAQFVALILCASVFSSEKSYLEKIKKEVFVFAEQNFNSLQMPNIFEKFIQTSSQKKSIMILGEGEFYGLAQEFALKIKETSYVHAECLPLGEILHGPVALLSQDIPTIIFTKEISTSLKQKLEKLSATRSDVFMVCEKDLTTKSFDHLYPICFSFFMHLTAFEIAYTLNLPIDQPRHLVKSVTLGGS